MAENPITNDNEERGRTGSRQSLFQSKNHKFIKNNLNQSNEHGRTFSNRTHYYHNSQAQDQRTSGREYYNGRRSNEAISKRNETSNSNERLSRSKSTEAINKRNFNGSNNSENHDHQGTASTLNCRSCQKKYVGKIFLCSSGHSLCEKCSSVLNLCPKCFGEMTGKRNKDLEAIINGGLTESMNDLRVSCLFNGCNYKLQLEDYKVHKTECKFREHTCHVSSFSKINCNWRGSYEELPVHYEKCHPKNCRLSTNVKYLGIQFDFSDFRDTQLLYYLGTKQLFYYKCKVDATEKKFYIIFQFVGDSKEARNYTYEFEINKDLRKYKITGYCVSDVEDCESIFKEENCICISFKHLRHYLDDNNVLNVRFRINNVNYVQKPKDHKLLSFDEKGWKIKN